LLCESVALSEFAEFRRTDPIHAWQFAILWKKLSSRVDNIVEICLYY
jgi:hypothetical protein